MIQRTILTIPVVLLIFAGTQPAVTRADTVADALHARMEELQFAGDLEIGGAHIAARTVLPAIYADRSFQPMWTDPDRIQELLTMLERAPDDGLETDDYYVEELRRQMAETQAGGAAPDVADLDILLTEALIRYGYHQLFGKVNPAALDPNINFSRKFLDDAGPVAVVPAVIASPQPLQQQFDDDVHRSVVYRTLQGHLADYREIAAAGGWPEVTVGATLHPGDTDERVALLRKRLAVTGDLPSGSDVDSTTFDEALRDAVLRFQRRHALDADGLVGTRSYAALNVPVEARIDQLRLSLERLRWLRGERAERMVVVNIAGFRVFFVVGDDIVWASRAMVGSTYRQTPVFRGTMQYLEINPTWTVPPGILRKDVLPAIKRDPEYLRAKNMSVIDRDGRKIDPDSVDWQSYTRGIPYSIRQEPGPGNALGEIKLIFPNRHFVFLHDTSHRELFSQPERTFSSGCIRVEHPFELAELVLNEPGKWDQDALKSVRDTQQTRRINAPDDLPVLVLYLTASVERDGRLRFLKDVYDRDARLLRALNGDVVIE